MLAMLLLIAPSMPEWNGAAGHAAEANLQGPLIQAGTTRQK